MSATQVWISERKILSLTIELTPQDIKQFQNNASIQLKFTNKSDFVNIIKSINIDENVEIDLKIHRMIEVV